MFICLIVKSLYAILFGCKKKNDKLMHNNVQPTIFKRHARWDGPYTEEDVEWWACIAGSAGMNTLWSGYDRKREPYLACLWNILDCWPMDYIFIHKDHPLIEMCKYRMESNDVDGVALYWNFNECVNIDGEWYKFDRASVNTRFFVTELV